MHLIKKKEHNYIRVIAQYLLFKWCEICIPIILQNYVTYFQHKLPTGCRYCILVEVIYTSYLFSVLICLCSHYVW